MTSRLTADRSTKELLRNKGKFDLLEFNSCSQYESEVFQKSQIKYVYNRIYSILIE